MLGISRLKSILPYSLNLKKRFTPKLTFKTWLFFVTSLFIIGIGIYLLQQSRGVKAAWFDDQYTYRQRIPISNSGSVQTDFQVGITLNTSALVSAGKMQSDCDDLRVVSENGESLPYWIQEQTGACNTTTTRIWTKIPSIPTSDTNIYVYYGNPVATNSQKPDQVFLFFDDFNGTSLNTGKWGTLTHASGTGASYNILGGTINFTTTTAGGYQWIHSRNQIPSAYWVEGNVRNNYATSGNVLRIGQTKDTQIINGNVFPNYSMDDAGNSTMRIVGDTTTGGFLVTSVANGTTSGIWRFGWLATSSQQAFLNDTSILVGTNNTIPIGNSYLYAGAPTNSTFGTVTMDWIFARKYAATAPTIGTFGSEEIGEAPVGYWKLDEGYGTTAQDASGNANNGSFNGAPAWQSESQCISGKCLSLDGVDDAITTVDKNEFSPIVNDITISVWAKVPSASSCGSNTCYIMSKGTTGQWEWGLFNNTETSIHFVAWNSSGTAMIDTNYPMQMDDDKWHHYAVSIDYQSTVNLYVDGMLRDTDSTWGGALSNGTQALQIGRRGTGQYFRGFIDEPKIYPYARSAAQIKADFIKGASSKGSSAVLGAEDQSYLSNGLAGYWKMDENTWVGNDAVLDSSGNLYAGTANGNAGITAPGRFGNGGVFDGNNDNVTVTNSPSGTTTNRLTVSAWVYPRSPGNWARMVTKENTSNQAEYRLLYDDTGKVYGLISLDSNEIGPEKVASIPNLTWSLLTMTYDGSKIIFYVNGSEVSRIAATGSITTPSSAVLTFGSTPNLINEFTGNLDEVRIYNRALSPREVSQLYEWAPGPVVHYKMDENAGSSVSDISANGYTGSFGAGSSAPIWEPGKYGSSLKFDGTDDRVDIGTSTATISGTPTFTGDQITVSAWVKASDDYAFAGIVGKASNSNWTDGFGLFTQADGISPRFYINTYNANFAVGNTLVQNNWNFLVGTYDGATIRMYVNGKEGISDSYTGNINDAGLLQIGTIGYYTTEFEGNVDDVRIYNYVRTSKQITQDMNAGHPAVGSPVASALAHWKLDEGYGSTAYSGGNAGSTLNGTFGTGTSAPTWSNNGKFGKALSFDGSSDYFTAIGGTVLNAPDEFTISLWANPTKYTGNSQQQGFMVGKGIYPNYNYRLLTDASSGGNKFEVGVQVGSTGFLSLSTTNTFSTNTWHNVVGSYDGNNLKIYVNGVLDNNVAIGGTLNTNATALYVGKYSNGVGYEYKGLLDEIKIYNYGLSDEEVKVEYNQGKAIVLGAVSTGLGGTTPSNSLSRSYCPPGDTTTCNSPVAEWLFNENVGGTANDTSENTNVGNFAGGNSSPAWAPGIQGSGLRFDGTHDYVQVSDNNSLDITSVFSISGWVKLNSLTGTQRLVAKETANGGTTASSYGFGILSTGKLRFTIFSVVDVDDTGANSVQAGKWYHIAVTHSGTSYNFYINGILNSSITNASNATANAQPLLIGRRNTTVEFLNGSADQVRIYDYARTPAQIAWEYSKGTPVAWYKMDECEGTTIYNSTPTFNDMPAGYNGTLTLGATGVTTAGTCATSGAWANGASGKRGSSMSFDGSDDHVSITDPTDGSLDFGTRDFSVAYWINTTASGSSKNIIEKRQNSATANPGFSIGINSSGTVFGTIQDGTNKDTTNSKSAINDGSWHNVIIVFDRDSVTSVYIDGVLETTEAELATGSIDNSTNMYIGRFYGGGSSTYYYGLVDDVQIFNYALSPVQVKTKYNNGAVSFE